MIRLHVADPGLEFEDRRRVTAAEDGDVVRNPETLRDGELVEQPRDLCPADEDPERRPSLLQPGPQPFLALQPCRCVAKRPDCDRLDLALDPVGTGPAADGFATVLPMAVAGQAQERESPATPLDQVPGRRLRA